MESYGRYRAPAAVPGVSKVAGWLAGHVLLYLLLCLSGWLTVGLLLGSAHAGPVGVVLYPGVPVGVVLYPAVIVASYGFMFGLPTLLALVVLRFVGQNLSARTFRRTALLVLPLIAVVLPVELPPSTEYGAQLLVQVPIQVGFALLLRPPSTDPQHTDDDFLARWGLTNAAVNPLAEASADAEALPAPATTAGPARSWYAVLSGVLLWLVLLLAGGHPLLLRSAPLGPQRAAHPITGPGETVRFVADPGRQYLIYQGYTRPVGGGVECRYGGTYQDPFGSWVWSRPPGRVTHDGRVFRYRGVMSGVEGVVEMSCNDGPLLVEDSTALSPSPTGPVAVAAVSLPVLGIGYVAWARRRARVQRQRDNRPMDSTSTETGT